MNVPNLALPAVPLDAIDGVPSANALPTVALRRRYAQTVALALLDRPCWVISTWRRDLGETCPPMLCARGVAEDWPLTTIDQHGISVTILLRPIPFVDDLDALIEAAAQRMNQDLAEAGRDALEALANGQQPACAQSVNAEFGRAIFDAACAGHQAKRSAFEEAARGSSDSRNACSEQRFSTAP